MNLKKGEKERYCKKHKNDKNISMSKIFKDKTPSKLQKCKGVELPLFVKTNIS